MDDFPLVSPGIDIIHLAVDASPNGMIVVNEQGDIVLVNAAVEKMFGFTRQELIGNSIDTLVPDKAAPDHRRLREEYTAAPVSRDMGRGRELYGKRKGGKPFPLEIRLNPVTTTHGTYIIAAIIDITEKKHAEEMMYLAVEASPNGMVVMNESGKILIVNSTLEKMFGYQRSFLIGNSIEVLVPERFRHSHPQMRSHYMKAATARAMGSGRDLFAVRQNGEEFPVEIGLNPIQSPQGHIVLASIVDITERKQQEALILAALKEKEILLAEVHHRVKNNLQIIDSLLGMQSEKVAEQGFLDVFVECQNRVKSMAVIHQTLYESNDFSRVEFKTVVETIVRNLVNSYQSQAGQIDIRIILDDVQLSIKTSIPLALIINELCSNVLKHAYDENQSGIIQITLKQEASRDYTIAVMDRGRGLPETFDIDNTNTMGLMLVNVLCDQIGGKLTVSPRNPTQFNIRFVDRDG